MIELRSETTTWGCEPAVGAALIQHAAMTHGSPMRFEDLEPANLFLKVVTLSWESEQLLIAHCFLNGEDKTCVKWFAPRTLSDTENALVVAFLKAVNGHAIAQGFTHLPIGFRSKVR